MSSTRENNTGWLWFWREGDVGSRSDAITDIAVNTVIRLPFPVLEPRPAHVADRQWGEVGQRQPKSMRQIFVEQDFQSTGCNLGFSAKAISACIWSFGTEG
jgi:hypothetical protein